jgi:hypothetical protein
MDYSATTPVDPRVVDKMIPYLREQFGNPGRQKRLLKKRVPKSQNWLVPILVKSFGRVEPLKVLILL